jgi:hypothetical protein
MGNFLFIVIFIVILILFFRIFGFIGHLFKLDNFTYSPSDHGFIKKGSRPAITKKEAKKELVSKQTTIE